MKSFKEFQESVAQEVGGKNFTSAVLSGISNLTKGPLKKAATVAKKKAAKKKAKKRPIKKAIKERESNVIKF